MWYLVLVIQGTEFSRGFIRLDSPEGRLLVSYEGRLADLAASLPERIDRLQARVDREGEDWGGEEEPSHVRALKTLLRIRRFLDPLESISQLAGADWPKVLQLEGKIKLDLISL